ncbi:MAG: tetratricopeptide repeat protein [Candidatus Eremiobacterota bacterium]
MNKCVFPVIFFLIFTMTCVMAENSDELLNTANVLMEEGSYEKAIPVFDKVLVADGKCEIAWFRKAIALYKIKKYDEASSCFDELIKITGGSSDVWYFKGLTLYKQDKYKESVTYFDKVLEVAPESLYSANTVGEEYICPWYPKGMALYKLGDYEGAVQCFDKTVTIIPDFAIGWHNKGEALKKLGRYKEGEECFNKEKALGKLEKTPERSQTSDEWFLKGCDYFRKGIWSKALEWFDRALENEPDHAFSLFYKGMVYSAKKDHGKALEYMDKAIKLMEDGKDVSTLEPSLAYSGKAMVLLSLDKYNEAKDFADKSIKSDPASADAYFTRGMSLCYLKDFKEALKSIDKSLELDPKFVDAWYYKSMILYFQGNI